MKNINRTGHPPDFYFKGPSLLEILEMIFTPKCNQTIQCTLCHVHGLLTLRPRRVIKHFFNVTQSYLFSRQSMMASYSSLETVLSITLYPSSKNRRSITANVFYRPVSGIYWTCCVLADTKKVPGKSCGPKKENHVHILFKLWLHACVSCFF